jgi:hypothetical protein
MSMESIFEAIAGIVQKLGASIIAIIGAIIAAIALLFKWIFDGSSSSSSTSYIPKPRSTKMRNKMNDDVMWKRDYTDEINAVREEAKKQLEYYKNVNTETLKNAAEEIDKDAKNVKGNKMSPSLVGKVERTKSKIKKLKKINDDLVGKVIGLSKQIAHLKHFCRTNNITWKDMSSFYFKNYNRSDDIWQELRFIKYNNVRTFLSKHVSEIEETNVSKMTNYCNDLIDRLLNNPNEVSNFITSAINTICKILNDSNKISISEYFISNIMNDKSKYKLYQDILLTFKELSHVPFQLLVFGIMDLTNLLLLDLEVELTESITKNMNDNEKKEIYDDLVSYFNEYKESILKCSDVMKSSISNIKNIDLLLDINQEMRIPDLPRPMFAPKLSNILNTINDDIKRSKRTKMSVEQAFELIPFFYFLDNQLEKVNLSSIKLDIVMGFSECMNRPNHSKEQLSNKFAGFILERFKNLSDGIGTMIYRLVRIYNFNDEKGNQSLHNLLVNCMLTIAELRTILNEKNHGKEVEVKVDLSTFGKQLEKRKINLTEAKFPIDPHIKKLTLTSLRLTNFLIRAYIHGPISILMMRLNTVMSVYMDAMNAFVKVYDDLLSYIHDICEWLHFMMIKITDTYVKEHNK